MTTGPAPLRATITGGTITTDNVHSVAFTTPILDYLGDPLYCKVLVSHSTLVVLIDKDGPSALGPFASGTLAKHVSVTVKSQASISTWGGELVPPYRGGELEFAIEASLGLRYVSFAIRPSPLVPNAGPDAADAPAAGGADAPTDENDASLGYVAVEVDGQPGTLQLYFLADPPTITNFRRLTTAAIVPPGQPPGSIGGPMGVVLTS
jgi:hypothetical protein